MKINWKSINIKELAAIVSDKLNESGFDTILVGGACVSIYTKNKYLSGDLDFVSSGSVKEISPVLFKLGFERKSSRHFEKKDCPFFIEFVSPPAALGSEPVRETNILKTRLGDIILLTPTDSVKTGWLHIIIGMILRHWSRPCLLRGRKKLICKR